MLFACETPTKPNDPVPGDDTAPATTDDTGWHPDTPCALSDPLAIDTSQRTFYALFGPGIDDLAGYSTYARTAATEYGCPTVTDTPQSTVITGDCDLPGWTHTGTWSLTPEGVRLDAVAFTGPDAPDATFAGDGQAVYAKDADENPVYTVDLVEAQAGLAGAVDEDGTWEIHYADTHDGDTETYAGWFRHAPPGGAAAEWCLSGRVAPAQACTDEPAGAWALVGDHTLIVRYDPDVRCDGCGNATIDGEDAGLVCW